MNAITKQVVVVAHADRARRERVRSALMHPGARVNVMTSDSPRAALDIVDQHEVQAVFCDLESRLESGVSMLAHLENEHPRVARLAVSRHPDMDRASPDGLHAQQILGTDDSSDELRHALERVLRLNACLHSDRVQAIVGEISQLPSVPQSYLALVRAAKDPSSGLNSIASIVQSDPAMSLKVLQLVNSAFFGLSKRIASIEQAVALLGVEMLKALAMSAQIFTACEMKPQPKFSIERFQTYSILTARFASRFFDERSLREAAFTAGMVHDIGKLIIAMRHPREFDEVLTIAMRDSRPFDDVERQVLGASHAEIGAHLLSRWGIPFPIVECVALHHSTADLDGHHCELIAGVHAADALTGILSCGDPESVLDTAFIERCGLTSQLPRWRKQISEALRDVA